LFRDDVEPTRHVVNAFKTLGDNLAESLGKGGRVFFHGTITTDTRTDKETGHKRTAQRVLAEIVGPACVPARLKTPCPQGPWMTSTPTLRNPTNHLRNPQGVST
jgi:hypothetical protein